MTLDDLEEAVSVVTLMMTTLNAAGAQASGIVAANFHYGVNDLFQNAEDEIRAATIGTAMLNVFNLATLAGATIAELEVVRKVLVGLTLTTPVAVAVCNAGIEMTLQQEVAVYANTTFTSRQQVAAAISQINCAFASAIEYASDNQQPDNAQALVAANAAIVRHLDQTARPLPKMISYSVGRVMTSLTLANYLYGDASRANELTMENGIINPNFCPPTGAALSS